MCCGDYAGKRLGQSCQFCYPVQTRAVIIGMKSSYMLEYKRTENVHRPNVQLVNNVLV